MQSLVLINGSAVLSVRCASDLIPGTGQTGRHRNPLTVAPLAGTGLVATLTPRIPPSAAVRTTNEVSFNEAFSSTSLRVIRREALLQSDLANGLNRNGERRVSIRTPSETKERFRDAPQGSYGFDSATLANAMIVAILLDCGWGQNPLA